jgi:2-dehydropantoate 2-reductase
MRVLVVGAGAVGGYFGLRLEQAGHQVTLVARGEHGARVREHGLVIETSSGTLVSHAPVVEAIEAAEPRGAEVVLVTVKTRDLAQVKPRVGDVLTPGGWVVSLLNGLDSERELAEVVPPECVFGGKVMIAAGRVAPGHLYVRAGGAMMLAP